MFVDAIILHVPRDDNGEVYDLAQQAFGYKETPNWYPSEGVPDGWLSDSGISRLFERSSHPNRVQVVAKSTKCVGGRKFVKERSTLSF